MLDLFHKTGKLKTIPRAGWLRCKVNNPESVADHTFRTAFMAMILGDILKLNTEKLLKMALLHDLPEIITGDITPFENLSLDEKRTKEQDAISELFLSIPNGDEYKTLWLEYAHEQSSEAILIRNLDKLEMALQASEYQKIDPGLNLNEFVSDAENQINIEEVKILFEMIKH